ncbi:hypothetical protein M430DRAFT_244488 [Amorphotheca resinae ATCC 22711]|uniref:Uncharacterized protein n=1 Tax=Amorphotheca resinae ATCC 22711 TaxID=857342 RepID=A0A2T3B2R2_AMORE|nr:hypothetical protein M430DRAFT_244488 [Amorphotheca resinae ATCC 22711]PSS18844.1 hypothetical protein M430DRAFT_244488 [Amorphotheca resinae ATCC 22711]
MRSQIRCQCAPDNAQRRQILLHTTIRGGCQYRDGQSRLATLWCCGAAGVAGGSSELRLMRPESSRRPRFALRTREV